MVMRGEPPPKGQAWQKATLAHFAAEQLYLRIFCENCWRDKVLAAEGHNRAVRRGAEHTTLDVRANPGLRVLRVSGPGWDYAGVVECKRDGPDQPDKF
jgi:hypothetical protein